mmetsp:Transcript_23314/g.61020  ORF Transcript_23314/g.61020 Transcript_23314/m.61020 type:complete len:262 (-) Transcript_23314:632-1417(-)
MSTASLRRFAVDVAFSAAPLVVGIRKGLQIVAVQRPPGELQHGAVGVGNTAQDSARGARRRRFVVALLELVAVLWAHSPRLEINHLEVVGVPEHRIAVGRAQRVALAVPSVKLIRDPQPEVWGGFKLAPKADPIDSGLLEVAKVLKMVVDPTWAVDAERWAHREEEAVVGPKEARVRGPAGVRITTKDVAASITNHEDGGALALDVPFESLVRRTIALGREERGPLGVLAVRQRPLQHRLHRGGENPRLVPDVPRAAPHRL